MSRFRIKKKKLHRFAGVDEGTWTALVENIELKGGATEEDFLGVITLVSSLYEHPIECPRCHQQSWKLYGFVEPGSENEPLWVPADGSTHYRLCQVPTCGYQDKTEFTQFSNSLGRKLAVTWFCDLVVGVEFLGMEDDSEELTH